MTMGVPAASTRFRIVRVLGLLAVGAVYVAAGGLKVAAPKAFAKAIVEYQLVPERLAPLVAVLLPWWEVAAGGLVMAGAWRRGALGVLAGLSAAFLVVGTVTLARGMSPPCGCFGIGSNQIGPATVVLELSLLVLTAALLRLELQHKTNHGDTESTEASAGGGSPEATQA
jgi:putative oxidoreductase